MRRDQPEIAGQRLGRVAARAEARHDLLREAGRRGAEIGDPRFRAERRGVEGVALDLGEALVEAAQSFREAQMTSGASALSPFFASSKISRKASGGWAPETAYCRSMMKQGTPWMPIWR